MTTFSWLSMGMLAVALGCTRDTAPKSPGPLAPAAATDGRAMSLFVATLTPQNPELAGRRITGTASFVARSDQLDVTLDVRGLTDGTHIAMLQGFVEERDAACPTRQADRNRDGILDAAETSTTAGQPLVPLNFRMSTLGIASDDYPDARNGRLLLEHSSSRSDLLASLEAEYGIRRLAIENYAVVVYGVSELSNVPSTAHPLANATSWQSVPIACGVVTRIR